MADNSKHSLADLLRHPLANVVIGFLLTGVLGTTLTQCYIVQRDKQAKQQELAATRKESIAKLSAPIDGRVEEALRLNREMYRSVVQQACE